MFRIVISVLLATLGLAAARDGEVEEWIRRMGTVEERPFEALNALIRLGEPAIAPVLAAFRDAEQPEGRRWQAAKVLGALEARVAVPDLLDGLESPSLSVAACSAEALGTIGERAALPRLKERFGSESRPQVKGEIEKAIDAIERGSGGAGDPEAAVAFAWIPWAATIEEALARAKDEKRLVLAIVTPWDDKRFESGHAGAAEIAGFRHPGAAAPAPARIEGDPGYVKERAILTALFGHPDLSALVQRCFVPVRLRMHTWHFLSSGSGPWTDPLPALGLRAGELKPPALVFCDPNGKLVHRVDRMAVFSPYLSYRTCLSVLEKHPSYRPSAPHGEASDPGRAEELLRRGRFAEARKALPKLSEGTRQFLEARMLALQGDLAAAEELLGTESLDPAAAALRGEILVRTGRFREAAELLAPLAGSLPPEGSLHLALAERALGRDTDARARLAALASRTPDEPVSAQARLLLDPNGPFPREWITLRPLEVDPLLATTESSAERKAPVDDAVLYLLSQQVEDGSWPEPFHRSPPSPSRASEVGSVLPRTALCVSALLAHQGRVREDLRAPVLEAIRKGSDFVEAWGESPSAAVWHLTYALHLELIRFPDREGEDQAPARARIERILARIAETEHGGGWTYTAPPRLHTFNTAPILLLLCRARELGFEVDEALLGRAADFLERNRVEKVSVFHYGPSMEYMTPGVGAQGRSSSCHRSPLCELALAASGRPRAGERIREALEVFFENLAASRSTAKIFESYVDPPSMQDSYRFFFGTWYAARAISRLPAASRAKHALRLRERVLPLQEIDGSFADSLMIGKSSSTALALLTLAELP